MTERTTVLASYHGLHIAGHRVHPILNHAGGLRQERNSVGLEHDVVALVGFRLQSDVLGGGSHRDGGRGGGRHQHGLLHRLLGGGVPPLVLPGGLPRPVLVLGVHAGRSGGQQVGLSLSRGWRGAGGPRGRGLSSHQGGGGDGDQLPLGGLNQDKPPSHLGGTSGGRLPSSVSQLANN